MNPESTFETVHFNKLVCVCVCVVLVRHQHARLNDSKVARTMSNALDVDDVLAVLNEARTEPLAFAMSRVMGDHLPLYDDERLE